MKRLLFCIVIIPVFSFAQPVSDAIDLGLSVKWASHNIGATRSEQTGDLFAWGEISTKSKHTANNYQYKDGDSGWTIDIGKEISTTEYDAAKALWKGDWRMPTQKEMLELVEKCTWTWTQHGKVKGYEVIGPNGNRIFMPVDKDERGNYWTSTLSQGLGRSAVSLILTPERYFMFGYYKYEGKMIRPVMTNPDFDATTQLPEEWRDQKYSSLIDYIQNEDYESAFVEATILAGSGDPKAQCVLASMYVYGAGTAQNYEAAQEQLSNAAAKGYNRAEYFMGGFGSLEKMHEFVRALTGEIDISTDINFWNQMMSTNVVPNTYKDAFQWFLLEDGKWGYRDIMYYCGIALLKGSYGYQNQEHGIQWIYKSAQLGYPDAINLINSLMSENDDLEEEVPK